MKVFPISVAIIIASSVAAPAENCKAFSTASSSYAELYSNVNQSKMGTPLYCKFKEEARLAAIKAAAELKENPECGSKSLYKLWMSRAEMNPLNSCDGKWPECDQQCEDALYDYMNEEGF